MPKVSDNLKKRAGKVSASAIEAQQAAVKAEQVLMALEDRDSRRAARTQSERDRLAAIKGRR